MLPEGHKNQNVSKNTTFNNIACNCWERCILQTIFSKAQSYVLNIAERRPSWTLPLDPSHQNLYNTCSNLILCKLWCLRVAEVFLIFLEICLFCTVWLQHTGVSETLQRVQIERHYPPLSQNEVKNWNLTSNKWCSSEYVEHTMN